jgi:hypothetical protein
MNSHRKTAIIVGVLFLTSTVAFMLGSIRIQSYFIDKHPNINQLIIGVLLEVCCGVAVAGIGVMMFPILKKFNERLALGYVIFRIIECAIIIVSGIYLISLLKLIQDYDLMIYLFTGIGGLIFSYLLYRSKLVPRLISVLGLIGYASLLTGTLLDMLGHVDLDGAGMIVLLPGGLFEIILPIWLIVKGFNPSAIASGSAKTDINEIK